MERRLGEFIEKVKSDFNLRCCGTKHEDWHFYFNSREHVQFYKNGFVSSKRHVKNEIAASEFIVYVLIEAIASVKFFKGINSSDNENFYKYLLNNGYEDLSYESFNDDLEQWLYTEDYQMFINGYYLGKYVKENILNGELKMFAQFVKNDSFYSRIVDYFSGEFISSRGLRTYNNEYLEKCNNPISDFTQKVLSYGYEKMRQPVGKPLMESINIKEESLDARLIESNDCFVDTSVTNEESVDEVSCEDYSDDNVSYKSNGVDSYNFEDNQMSLIGLTDEIEVSDIEFAFVNELNMIESNGCNESFVEEDEIMVSEGQVEYKVNEDDYSHCEVKEECSVEEDVIVEKYTTTILDDSDEMVLFKVRFTEEEMELAEALINKSLKLLQIELIENCNKAKDFNEISQYILAANVVLGKIILLKSSPFDAIKMNMYEAECIKFILSKSKIKEHDTLVRNEYIKIETLFEAQTKLASNKKEKYNNFISGKTNSKIMKLLFENK